MHFANPAMHLVHVLAAAWGEGDDSMLEDEDEEGGGRLEAFLGLVVEEGLQRDEVVVFEDFYLLARLAHDDILCC